MNKKQDQNFFIKKCECLYLMLNRKIIKNEYLLVEVFQSLVPKHFIDPLTLKMYEKPVQTCDGQIYEQKEIEKWFKKGNQSSPLTQKNLIDQSLRPVIQLQLEIQNFIKIKNLFGVNENLDLRYQLEELNFKQQKQIQNKQDREALVNMASVKLKKLSDKKIQKKEENKNNGKKNNGMKNNEVIKNIQGSIKDLIKITRPQINENIYSLNQIINNDVNQRDFISIKNDQDQNQQYILSKSSSFQINKKKKAHKSVMLLQKSISRISMSESQARDIIKLPLINKKQL